MRRYSPWLAVWLWVVPGLAVMAADPGQPFAVLGSSRVSDGRLIAPFYDYVIWPHAVAVKDTVYCVFQNAQGHPIAMAYQSASKTWQGPVKISQFGLRGDDHGNPALVADGQGYLHVFYGCHGGPMRHAKSVQPHDIATWQEQPSPVPHATYPQTMRMKDGRLLLFYRAGGHMEPWTLQVSDDDGRTWGPPQAIVEMRKAPPDQLAAAYCFMLPGSDGRTVHLFWNHKDDNAARVTDARPHPWRPLKYAGLHEAVYRYNVYYLKRDADGAWVNAAGEPVALPVSKAEADRRCLVYDSGDEFTMVGRTRMMIDEQDRPFIRFGTGVVDWVKRHDDPNAALVPITDRFAMLVGNKWQVSPQRPDDWPTEIGRLDRSPGVLVPGEAWPGGHWFIFSQRRPVQPGLGCSVLLYNDETGYATRPDGPALVD